MPEDTDQGVALEFEDVSRTYPTAGSGSRHALDHVSFVIPRGRIVAVVGRSGSGKSTLLHLAAGIDVPTAGTITAFGRSVGSMDQPERTAFRRGTIGLVFQFFHLLPHLSVFENVILPALIAGDKRASFAPRATALLDRMGLADRAGDSIDQLSGGEMQRVAIARALIRTPRLVLADEPTGNLDDTTGRTVMELLTGVVRDVGATLVCVTHSREAAGYADDVWEIRSGQLLGA
jgi:ABC-type lipoprotein export system ATPase subunit